jgi:hypothetical protein
MQSRQRRDAAQTRSPRELTTNSSFKSLLMPLHMGDSKHPWDLQHANAMCEYQDTQRRLINEIVLQDESISEIVASGGRQNQCLLCLK